MKRHKKSLQFLFICFFVPLVMPGIAVAQDFKLPSLFPFKKQSQEVKPFQLTDQAKGGRGAESTPWNSFSQKSKDFFSRTGDGISSFTSNMRSSLKNMESPGWEFDKKTHWWNDQPDMDKLHYDLDHLGMRNQQGILPPQPQPRTAQGIPNDAPRYRF